MTTRKTIAFTIWIFVGKVTSLLFNTLSRFVIAFLPRGKCLLISWLQSPSTVILAPKKIKYATASTFSFSICHKWWDQMPWSWVFECWVLICDFKFIINYTNCLCFKDLMNLPSLSLLFFLTSDLNNCSDLSNTVSDFYLMVLQILLHILYNNTIIMTKNFSEETYTIQVKFQIIHRLRLFMI